MSGYPELSRDRLGGVDRASTADADQAVGAAGGCDRCGDRLDRRMTPHANETRRDRKLELAESLRRHK